MPVGLARPATISLQINADEHVSVCRSGAQPGEALRGNESQRKRGLAARRTTWAYPRARAAINGHVRVLVRRADTQRVGGKVRPRATVPAKCVVLRRFADERASRELSVAIG